MSDLTNTQTDFGKALSILKSDKKVTRSGWNDKNMYLFLVGKNIAIKAADQEIVPWIASEADLLAEDWYLVTA